ncbi:MAG: class I SAM-dependent methyltransferase [Methanobacteriota archaeon]|nr:MAG: class I SAM-dependent methyltransferase [Euryarchaeota archaeon]
MEEDDLVEMTVRSYDECAEEYSRYHFGKSFRNRLGIFLEHLPDGELVLDVGCGSGRDVKYLIEHGINAIGIDLSKRIVAQAKKYVPEATFHHMDMRKLTFEESTFSGILAMASVLHLPKRELPDLLAEFSRVLKEGGLLYLSLIAGSREKIVRRSVAVEGMGPRFFAFYEMEELKNSLGRARFDIVHSFVDEDLGVDWLNVYAKK